MAALPAKIADRVQETTATTGTGTITLAGAVANFRTFASAFPNQATTKVKYAISSGSAWEVGEGTFTLSGTTLSRDKVEASSNSGGKITLAGTSNVWNDASRFLIVGGLKAPNVQAANFVVPSPWYSRTPATNGTLRSICWSSQLGIFCIVAGDSVSTDIQTSPDGVTWTSRTPASNKPWISVCWSPELGLFCAISTTNEGSPTPGVMTSPDGITWTSRTPAATKTWISVCWSPELGLFCAVANNSTSTDVMTSPDGITWTSRTPASNASWQSVCWSPQLGLFCSVDSNGGVMTSPDGITWTTRTASAAKSWDSVCWSPELGLFCSVAAGNTSTDIQTSPDGVTWTARTTPANKQWKSVCWSPELGLFCAVANNSTSTDWMTSPDGITWTSRTPVANKTWCGVCWSPELGIFCAISSNFSIATTPPSIWAVTKVHTSAPTITSGGGTSPSVVGTDEAALVTIGTGGIATNFTLTFNKAFANAPVCSAHSDTDIVALKISSTTTTVTVTATAAFTASSKVHVTCRGYGE